MSVIKTRNLIAPLLAGAVSVAALTAPANAEVLRYRADLVDVNNLGASGVANLSHDTDTNELTVTINASGLDDGIHVQHIHGVSDASGPVDSLTPTIAVDSMPNGDGDGIIELAEAAPTYGPILLSLSNPPGLDPLGSEGGFPTTGDFFFEQVYDLDDDIFAGSFTVADVLPLFFREIVIHGAFLGQGVGSGPGEADGVAGYKATLPVLAGEIAPVPVPGAALLLLTGLAGAPLLRKRKKAAASA